MGCHIKFLAVEISIVPSLASIIASFLEDIVAGYVVDTYLQVILSEMKSTEL